MPSDAQLWEPEGERRNEVPRLNWSAVGERFYEAGVDRGVLYVGELAGVPWPGLVSVSESPRGGEARPFYIDGFKYANVAASEEFEATISAFQSPPEFATCDGVSSVHNGLFATQQPRKPFGLSYRTKLGNDTEGVDFAYKIHLVYNALAAPSGRTNSTVGQQLQPNTLSWSITTLPPAISGLRPTAHFVIDSRNTPEALLADVEDILYGSEVSSARLPSVAELLGMFNV